jgi:hypothetical membrane protein
MPRNIAGILLYLSGTLLIMGTITSEIFYPGGYHTGFNAIRDLGATKPPNSIIHQPSASIFNYTLIVSGALILFSALMVFISFKKSFFSFFLGFFGLSLLCIGVFPSNVVPLHNISAFAAFFFGGLSAIISFEITNTPFKIMGIIAGLTSFIFLFGSMQIIPIIEVGGFERWVAYPVVIWLTGLGGYLLGHSSRQHFRNN